MARLNVNPTRMELKKLKARLDTAVRGHKLLKDKSDEMIRRFSVIIKENKRLRDEVEKALGETLKQFSVARSVTPAYQAETAFAMPSVAVSAECGTGSVMGVEVPALSVNQTKRAEGLPYAFSEMTGEADYSVERAGALIPKMLKLAEVEKTVRM
ncbi:MAG: V-type ATP synthase subunit D, partial [Clostridia bacterium]|nr:V-type ATP synthase subunit D [Clostridia bacterium]